MSSRHLKRKTALSSTSHHVPYIRPRKVTAGRAEEGAICVELQCDRHCLFAKIQTPSPDLKSRRGINHPDYRSSQVKQRLAFQSGLEYGFHVGRHQLG